MKFTIKNLKIEDQVQLEELSVEVTSQDIKENGLSILNIIKEVKPLIKEYMDTESKQEQKPLVDDEVEDVKPKTSEALDELLKTLKTK